MNGKKLGLILILLSVFFLVVLIIFKLQINSLVQDLMVESGGTCIKDGKCLHEQSDIPVYIGIAVIFMMFALGLYLIFFERSERNIEKAHKEIVDTLRETKENQDLDEKFKFLLKALNEDEKKIMNAVREQDGVEQATLRIRTDLSKAKLSVLLTELEKKGIIKKVPHGKKNRIYLKEALL